MIESGGVHTTYAAALTKAARERVAAGIASISIAVNFFRSYFCSRLKFCSIPMERTPPPKLRSPHRLAEFGEMSSLAPEESSCSISDVASKIKMARNPTNYPSQRGARGSVATSLSRRTMSGVLRALRLWLFIHQCFLVTASLAGPSLLSLPYLLLALLLMQGGFNLGAGRAVLVQLVLSNAAAIAAIAASTQLTDAFSGHLGVDIAMLVESLPLLFIATHCYCRLPYRTLLFVAPHVAAPAPIVASIALTLLTIVALLQPCVASLPLLTLTLLALAAWGCGAPLSTITRGYVRAEPLLRLYVATWIAAEHTHLVLSGLARAWHIRFDDFAATASAFAISSASNSSSPSFALEQRPPAAPPSPSAPVWREAVRVAHGIGCLTARIGCLTALVCCTVHLRVASAARCMGLPSAIGGCDTRLPDFPPLPYLTALDPSRLSFKWTHIPHSALESLLLIRRMTPGCGP